MRTYRVEDFINGWVYGNFFPSIYPSLDTEVGILNFRAGESGEKHLHSKSIEINVIVSGKMESNGQILSSGDIFVFHPFDISDTKFIEDTVLVCIKTPSNMKDKVLV